MKTPFRFLALAPVLTLGFSGCQNLIKPSDTTTTFYKDQVKATVDWMLDQV